VEQFLHYSKEKVKAMSRRRYASVPALLIALVKDFAFWAPFSWFVGAALGGIAYFVIARGRVRREAPVTVGNG